MKTEARVIELRYFHKRRAANLSQPKSREGPGFSFAMIKTARQTDVAFRRYIADFVILLICGCSPALGLRFLHQNQLFQRFLVLHMCVLNQVADDTSLGRGQCVFNYDANGLVNVLCVQLLRNDSDKQQQYNRGYL